MIDAVQNNDFPDCPDWDWLRGNSGRWPTLRMDQPAEALRRECRWSCVYLATPYSREVVDDQGRWVGVKSANQAAVAARVASNLAGVDITAISPIVQAHAMVTSGGDVFDPLSAGLWEPWCQRLLNICPRVVVPHLVGRARSRGVWREIRWALKSDRPVHIVDGAIVPGGAS